MGKASENRAASRSKRKAQRDLDPADSSQSTSGWRQGVLLPSLASAICLWLSFPPVGLALLAWLAPMGWLWVAERKRSVGRKGYWALWLGGCIFWLLSMQGVRLAFWPMYFGWIALSLYLGVYIPLFVGATRIMRHRWQLPLWFAAPTAWAGLELFRSYFLTGFASNTLAHSQALFPVVIQVVDQIGSGGLSFLMMVVSASALELSIAVRSKQSAQRAWRPVVAAAAVLIAVFGYGAYKLLEADELQASRKPLFRAVLLQENTPSVFESNPERNQLAWTDYFNLSVQATKDYGPVDLVVWPESTFTANEPWTQLDFSAGLPHELQEAIREGNMDRPYIDAYFARMQRMFEFKAERAISAVQSAETGTSDTAIEPTNPRQSSSTQLLVGCDRWSYNADGVERFNSALLLSPNASIEDYYDKMHLVMVGEYIPLGPALKWLGDMFNFANASPGTQPKSFPIGNARVAPSICFESMMPRLVRWQVQTLVQQDQSPDVLVNITNDSWFRGSSILDHHLACTILCAVENRRPTLVAANTGITAHIDGAGRVVQQTQRLTTQALLAEPIEDSRMGMVQTFGYPLSWACMVLTFLAFISTSRIWRRSGEVAKRSGDE